MKYTQSEKRIVTAKGELFAALNGGDGFKSFYDDIFGAPNIKRRYLIKGGPGTGKSTFMKNIADGAESRGFSVERYRCSSDPSSLDGIIINRELAIIDSTSPHSEEPSLLGARDFILDFGAFLSSEGLEAQRSTLEALAEKKKNAFSRAYRLLSIAESCDFEARALAEPYIDEKRVKRLAKRLFEGFCCRGGAEASESIGILRSIGILGRCYIDGFEKRSDKRIFLIDSYGVGALLLFELRALAREKGSRTVISYSPIGKDRIDGVLFENERVSFLLLEKAFCEFCECENEKSISLRRLINTSSLEREEKKALAKKYRELKKASHTFVGLAEEKLCEAGKYHFLLEEIYKKNMDFEALSRFTEEFLATKL